ncbi:MAG: aconitase/3-isopropylmalate dehydratase large subunit family protein [Eubacteriales bacterium]|nr:aconitase/3-isopropylmalate dehydratase large subunit family protein [Eubacteriales bacterium]
MSTIVEKIFSNHIGYPVKAGELVMVDVDASLIQDMNGPSTIKNFEGFAETVCSPEKHLFSLDHFSPSSSIVAANNHRITRQFVEKHNISHLVEEGKGIGHQLMIEMGLVAPGRIVVGTDSHCCHYGVLNAFSTGIGAAEEAVVLASDKCWFKVPETIRVEFIGKMPKNLTGKDLALVMVKELTQGGAIYQCLEFGGDTIADLEIDERAAICNMAVESGAKGAIMPCDQVLKDWMKERGWSETDGVSPDSDAQYARVLKINVSALTPVVAVPPDIDNVVPVSSMEKIAVNEVVIGGCTNGRYIDFFQAAQILKGKRIVPSVRLVLAPASTEIAKKMLDTGVYEILLDAGATILPPCCGPCSGITGGLVADNEVVLATANRNMHGRMGSQKGKIYIASPVVAAYTALAGYITAKEQML